MAVRVVVVVVLMVRGGGGCGSWRCGSGGVKKSWWCWQR